MILSNDCWMRAQCNINSTCADNHFCIKLFKMDYLCKEALLSDDQRKYIQLRAEPVDIPAFTKLKEIQDNIEEFVQSGKNAYIHSNITGNGKTRWCLRLMMAYLDKIWHKSDLTCRALFINVPRFLMALKNNISSADDYAEHIKKNVLDADLVVWDEIGMKTATEFEHDNLLSLINARIDSGKSNLYTSNLSKEYLKDRIGERLYSRVIGTSIDIEFFGYDKRGTKK